MPYSVQRITAGGSLERRVPLQTTEQVRSETQPASFEGWSAVVRDPLVWLGCADPVATQAALHTVAPTSPVEETRFETLGPPLFLSEPVHPVAACRRVEPFHSRLGRKPVSAYGLRTPRQPARIPRGGLGSVRASRGACPCRQQSLQPREKTRWAVALSCRAPCSRQNPDALSRIFAGLPIGRHGRSATAMDHPDLAG